MTPEEEREAARVAACEAHFLRRKPHELRFQPVPAETAFGTVLPAEVLEALGEREAGDAQGARDGSAEEAEGAAA